MVEMGEEAVAAALKDLVSTSYKPPSASSYDSMTDASGSTAYSSVSRVPSEQFADVSVGDEPVAGGSDWAMLQRKRPSQLMQVRGPNANKGSLRRVLLQKERSRTAGRPTSRDLPTGSSAASSEPGSEGTSGSTGSTFDQAGGSSTGSGTGSGTGSAGGGGNSNGNGVRSASTASTSATATTSANAKAGGVHVVLGLKDIGTIKKAKGYDPHNITKQHSFDVEDIQRRFSIQESDRPSSADIRSREQDMRRKQMMKRLALKDLDRPSSAQKVRRRRRRVQSHKMSKRSRKEPLAHVLGRRSVKQKKRRKTAPAITSPIVVARISGAQTAQQTAAASAAAKIVKEQQSRARRISRGSLKGLRRRTVGTVEEVTNGSSRMGRKKRAVPRPPSDDPPEEEGEENGEVGKHAAGLSGAGGQGVEAGQGATGAVEHVAAGADATVDNDGDGDEGDDGGDRTRSRESLKRAARGGPNELSAMIIPSFGENNRSARRPARPKKRDLGKRRLTVSNPATLSADIMSLLER